MMIYKKLKLKYPVNVDKEIIIGIVNIITNNKAKNIRFEGKMFVVFELPDDEPEIDEINWDNRI